MFSLSAQTAGTLQIWAGWASVATAVLTAVLGGLTMWASSEVTRHEGLAQKELNSRLVATERDAAEANARVAPRQVGDGSDAAFRSLHDHGLREVRLRLINGDAESTALFNQIDQAFGRVEVRTYVMAATLAGGPFGILVQGPDPKMTQRIVEALEASGLRAKGETIQQADGIPHVLVFPKEPN